MPPQVNLSFYKGADQYTDGAIEDELLEIVSSTRDFHSILKNDSRWPVLYHLSSERRNLLEWYPFKPDGALLEIGGGCGALTGLFAEKLADVTTVELSGKRAEIIAARHSAASNLKVYAGNFLDMDFEGKFDYVTLVGVLEYTKVFIKTKTPYAYLLNAVRRCMKPDGTLIIAIENKFGIKYFAGAPEDHTGRAFEGIEGYPGGAGFETFSKDELSTLLADNGFDRNEFYYPYPDYKLPEEVFSDRMLPDVYNNLKESESYDLSRVRLFSERRALLNLAKAGRFDYFSNSFLVFVSRKLPQ